ncbi:hypothetical protein GDO78_010496 [Eleutherodactylus coqui]|uniref:Leucine-rich repeat-containing protein 9 n=1 Tax=Eleutherodactylus coqui TaxID=57060 RepID=A0A8J6F725_ELECQ|nr:hypothetical protein GDO78_010496 [Eleutherodactylus coqui]
MVSIDVLNSEEIIKELCLCNGVNYDRIRQDGPATKTLEMFFSGFPKMVGLFYFPNLTNLTLVGQSIERICNLKSCPLLEELWVTECLLTRIEGLQDCQHLKKLFLYHNSITTIEGLENLNKLEVVWLNDNEIDVIEGLDTLLNLKELNLAGNLIHSIGICLDPNVHLERLNLSGNKISSFKSTVMKKLMYYNMRAKTISRQLREELEKLKDLKIKLEQTPKDRIKRLIFHRKILEENLSDLQASKKYRQYISKPHDHIQQQSAIAESNSSEKEESNRSDSDLKEQICQKLCTLKERIQFWTEKMDEIDSLHEKEVARTEQSFDLLAQFLQTELETVGNVRFEEGTPSDSWFKSCYDLILSRFCASNFKTFGITGVKINRIVRVHNRILRFRFEERLQDYLDNEDGTAAEDYKKTLEYLFYNLDPVISVKKNNLLQILEDGFTVTKNSQLYDQEQEESVLLSNSLGFYETSKLEQETNEEANHYDPELFKHGKLIISKVFLGHNVQAQQFLPIKLANYPDANSVFRPLKSNSSTLCSSDDEMCPSKELQPCDCSLRRGDWFVFDADLVLPEYIVEYEYITQGVSNMTCSPSSITAGEFSNEIKLDEDLIAMEPVIKPRPKIIALDERTILSIAKANMYSQITILNLHGNSLSKLKEISKLHGLHKLIISFNEFTSLEDVSCLPNLEYLDASHNHLISLEGFKGLGKLKHLDLSWNELTKTMDEINVLRRHAAHLLTLNVTHNPWQKPALVRMVVIGRLKSLTRLDGLLVTKEEVSESSKFSTGVRITQALLQISARTDHIRPRCLSLLPSAQIISQISKNCLDPYAEFNNSWYHMITSVNLVGQNLSRITNLEKLENLRWVSFSNNHLSRIEGLENCVKIEELCLDGNCITKLEGLSKLVNLRHLSINNNQLTSFDKGVIDNLSHLHFLSVENNRINSLAGLQKAQSLIELYLSNNQISNTQEIYTLKGLNNIVILDLHSNPISLNHDNYRLFVIFHLSPLKALDGSAVPYLMHVLCHCRSVDLVPADHFKSVHAVNLENNNLTSFSGLIFLSHVKSLYLNYNHIESILPRQKSQNHLTNRQILHQKVNSSGYGQQGKNNRDTLFGESLSPIMQSLEVLHLGFNGISNLQQLQLGRLKSLKSLFLQGNEISQVEGLECLQYLQELVLDHNRIKMISETSFAKQSSLVSLRMEENRLRDVNNLHPLVKLKKLFIGFNKIQDISEVEKLEALPTLLELSISGNPITRKMFHRQLIVLRLQNLQILDGIAVTSEERARAEMHFLEQQTLSGQNSSIEVVHPVSTLFLNKAPPLRVTNVYLPGGNHHHIPGPDLYLNNAQDDIFPNESNKHKKTKHHGGVMNNPRSVNAEIAFRQFKGGTSISSTYLQQGSQNRAAHLQGSNLEHEGRCAN